MKKLLLTMVAISISSMSVIAADIEPLLKAISIVESKSDDTAVGDNGKAIGRYQIWETYVNDVNRFAKTSYVWTDAKDPLKAKQIVILYLNYYGARYERLTGKKATFEVLARIHNGGPNGYKKTATEKYWNKVKKQCK